MDLRKGGLSKIGAWFRRNKLTVAASVAILSASSYGVWAIVSDFTLVGALHSPHADHLDQQTLDDLIASGHPDEAFNEAFEHGDELFETSFNALDGAGANVGNGQRFTRIPRADLSGPGQWATHVPARVTGPNAESCNSCHNVPSDDGAGNSSANVHRDPLHAGNLRKMIERNTPHTFGGGAVQRVAEEMSEELLSIRDAAKNQVCAAGGTVTKDLIAKGVSFGRIKVKRMAVSPCTVNFDYSLVKGVSTDLIIRPFHERKCSVLARFQSRRGSQRAWHSGNGNYG